MCLDEAVIELEPPQARLRTVVNILRFFMKRQRSWGFISEQHFSESFGLIFCWWFEKQKLAHLVTK